MPIKSPRIVGQGDCPRVAGQKPPMPSSGQSSKKTKMDKSITLPHIRIQLKESNKIQKSIRDVLVPRGHFKVNIEGESRTRYPRTGPKIYSYRDILVPIIRTDILSGPVIRIGPRLKKKVVLVRRSLICTVRS